MRNTPPRLGAVWAYPVPLHAISIASTSHVAPRFMVTSPVAIGVHDITVLSARAGPRRVRLHGATGRARGGHAHGGSAWNGMHCARGMSPASPPKPSGA